MAWRKRVTSFLGRRALSAGALGTGVATQVMKRQAREALGGAAQREQAEEYADLKGTRRARCVAAQIANGHIPEDMNEQERGYFFGS